MTNDFISEALSRMKACGVLVQNPLCDGALHRCAVEGKRAGNASGAYIIHIDDMPTAWWRNWVLDVEGSYCAKSEKEMTPKERKAFKERMRAIKEAGRHEQEARWNEAASRALEIWEKARPATNEHGYLVRKGVAAFSLRVDERGRLLVPVQDWDGKLMSLQRIAPEKPKSGSEKSFFPGGGISSGFYPIPARDGKDDGPLLIAEGYATAASLHEATGHAVLVAFDCGNLKTVATAARAHFPCRVIVVCADWDFHESDEAKKRWPEPGGIGVAKAREAALSAGACLAVCPLFEGRERADFNDLHIAMGAVGVERAIAKAIAAGPLTDCPIPAPFRLVKTGKRAGLYYMKESQDDGAPEEIRLGPPLEILGMTSDSRGENWGLLLAWDDPKGRRHEWAMPQALLYMQRGEWFATLAGGGWRGNPARRKEIARFLSEVRPVRQINCADMTGWANDQYVLPDGACGAGDGERTVLQTTGHEALYRRGGSFEAWLEAARLSCGNGRLGFALACSFAGPLLRLAGMEGGAFSFEGGSSCGKTTALHLAASVWGGPEHVRTWRATDNGLEGVAALFNDNLLALDDLGQIEGRALYEAAYMLGNGSGKTRAGRDDGLRPLRRWRAIILSSGEVSLSDKLNEAGLKTRAGQEVRFCGLPLEKGHIEDLHGRKDDLDLLREIRRLCAENYGYAGRMFLNELCKPELLADFRANLAKDIEATAAGLCPENADL